MNDLIRFSYIRGYRSGMEFACKANQITPPKVKPTVPPFKDTVDPRAAYWDGFYAGRRRAADSVVGRGP